MRTTVTINDALLAEVKIRAHQSHRTIGDVLDDALRVYLAGSESVSSGAELPRFRYAGGARVDLYDRDALDAALSDAVS